jgi:hypothetical protein
MGVGVDWVTHRRQAAGVSAFALEDGVVYDHDDYDSQSAVDSKKT